jgi:hypothetical protein
MVQRNQGHFTLICPFRKLFPHNTSEDRLIAIAGQHSIIEWPVHCKVLRLTNVIDMKRTLFVIMIYLRTVAHN